jgi:hypothetical protein
MTPEERKLEKALKFLEVANEDYVSSDDFAEVIAQVIEAVKSVKDRSEEALDTTDSKLSKEITKLATLIEKKGTDTEGKLGKLDNKIDKQIESVKSIISKLQLEKGDKGDRGEKGDRGDAGPAGKDGSPDMAEDIRNKLELLEGDERLDKSAIKGLDDIERIARANAQAAGVPYTQVSNLTNRVVTLEDGSTDLTTRVGDLEDTRLSGPASSTNYGLALWDGTDGLLLQDSTVTLDSGVLDIGSTVVSLTEGSIPATPTANKVKLYARDDGSGNSSVYFIDDQGIEHAWGTGGGGGGVTTFLGLTDTPSSYTSQGLKYVRVNSGGTALEFATYDGGVTSFNSRTGAVVPATNDYTWAQINKATSSIADITTKSHTLLSDIGTYTHAQLDAHIDSDTTAHALATNLLHTTGAETKSGVLTFSDLPEANTIATTASQLVNLQTVSNLIQGIGLLKEAVRLKTNEGDLSFASWTYANGTLGAGATLTSTTNVNLNTEGGVDGQVDVNNGDRVLIHDTSVGSAAYYGIYVVTSTGQAGVSPIILTRSDDYNTVSEILKGTSVSVLDGQAFPTGNENSLWVQTQTVNTVGTDVLAWQQLPPPVTYSATNGIVLSGTQFSSDLSASGAITLTGTSLQVAVDNSSIERNANALRVKALGITNAMLAGSIAASKLIGTDIATVGTITAGTWNADTIEPTYGGTGEDSSLWAQGDLPYISATGTWNHLAKNTSATRYLSNTGTTNNPAWAQIDLTNGVTGALPFGNGGTGNTSYVDGQLLIGNSATGGLTKATLTAGAGITVGNANGAITVSATGSGSGTTATSLVYDKAVNTDATTTTITNTTETTVYSTSSLGALTTSNVVRLFMNGSFANSSGSARTLTVRIKLGGTTIATHALSVASQTSAALANGQLDFAIYISNVGSTSVQAVVSNLMVRNNTATITSYSREMAQ